MEKRFFRSGGGRATLIRLIRSMLSTHMMQQIHRKSIVAETSPVYAFGGCASRGHAGKCPTMHVLLVLDPSREGLEHSSK